MITGNIGLDVGKWQHANGLQNAPSLYRLKIIIIKRL